MMKKQSLQPELKLLERGCFLLLAMMLLLSQFLFASTQENAGELEALAHPLAIKLAKSRAKSVVVFDLKTYDQRWLPLGAWLADQISAAPLNAGQRLQVIDRTRLAQAMEHEHLTPADKIGLNQASVIAKALGADSVVYGTFGTFGDVIGISLIPEHFTDSKGISLGVFNGRMPVGKEVSANLNVPLDSLRPVGEVLNPGEAGISLPECRHCPNPPFTSEAIKHLKQGQQVVVVLDSVITSGGRVTGSKIMQGVGYGLDEQAVQAVKNWEFKPALDPTGKPVTVHMIINVAFHLYP